MATEAATGGLNEYITHHLTHNLVTVGNGFHLDTWLVSLVLGLPTVGPLLLKALIAQDMFLAGTIVLLLGVMTVIGTLISDIFLVWIDPRIRLEET